MFSQYKFADPRVYGNSFYLFRNHYFDMTGSMPENRPRDAVMTRDGGERGRFFSDNIRFVSNVSKKTV